MKNGKIYTMTIVTRDPISPDEKKGFTYWFGNVRPEIKSVMAARYLSEYASRGAFREPGKYIMQIRRDGWKFTTALYKWNPATDEIIKKNRDPEWIVTASLN